MAISTRVLSAERAGPPDFDRLRTTDVRNPEPTVGQFLQRRAALYEGTALADSLDAFRSGSVTVLPVVRPTGHFQGLLREIDIAVELQRFNDAERIAFLKSATGTLTYDTDETLLPSLPVSEALERLQAVGQSGLPVVDSQGYYCGMLAASDIIPELVRPLRPPMLGGMATLTGVYLTTGNVSGGVGVGVLLLTGLLFCAIHTTAYFMTLPLLSVTASLPLLVRPAVETLLQTVIQIGLLLTLLRFSPMAGYHAAEHQVVHAVERGEPLTVENVRRMPRVHPRCGTNLVAGALLASLVGIVLQPLVGSLGYLIGGAAALAVWRDIGAWLQRNVTTRPATDQQIQSGITAAKRVIERHTQSSGRIAAPLARIWNMGFVPLIAGFLLGCGLIYLLSWWFPALKEPLHSYLLG